MRRKVIAGNWKMNMLPNEAIQMITELEPLVKDTNNEVVLCVPFTDLFYALNVAQGTNIKIGAQNMHFEEKGAFTGEVAPGMLKEINCEFVILGHSERRWIFGENDELINKKVISAFEHDLIPVLCVGEKLEERESGQTEQVILKQLENDLKGVSEDHLKNMVIAYEPVWAIGTGKNASEKDAKEACALIREFIHSRFGSETSDKVRILYGGSVKPENVKMYMSQEGIDGALVGGASLKADSFASLTKF